MTKEGARELLTRVNYCLIHFIPKDKAERGYSMVEKYTCPLCLQSSRDKEQRQIDAAIKTLRGW